MIQKLNLNILTHEYCEWVAENGSGRNLQDLRFGQYLCNKYFPTVPMPHVFYEEKASDAYNIVADHLIEEML
jgi:hypothetical protein